jgi:outer membrane protein assembly factor BamA
MRTLPFLSASLLVICSAFSVEAQTLNVTTITFSGDTISSADLQAASGLKPGQLDAAQVQAAAQRLNNSGLFSHIDFAVRGAVLQFQLTPATGRLPVRFENFPWWTDNALIETVHAALPLFHGSVIPGTGLDQQVADTLTGLLAKQQVTASVESHPEIAQGAAGPTAVRYRIATPGIMVGTVTLNGESEAMSTELAPIAKAASGEPYDAYVTPDLLQQAIRSVYGNHGYLDAAISRVAHGEPSADASGFAVPMALQIVEGAQYRLETMRFGHPLLLSEAEFQAKSSLHAGDVANQELLRRSLLLIGIPYRKQGYLDAKIMGTPSLDTAAKKVSYTIQVEPGAIYHFGKLSLVNVTDAQSEAFLKSWKVQAGDVYDATYPPGFLTANAKSLHAWEGYGATYREIRHLDTHIVDLEVTCLKNPSQH